MAINQRSKGFASALRFTGGDGDGGSVAQPDIAFDIPGTQWFFEPADFELGKGLRALQGGSCIPYTTRINQQRRVIADACARAAHEFQIERFVLTHWLPSKLHGLIAGFDPPVANLLGLPPIASEQNRSVSFNPFMLFAAEQPMDRFAEMFSFQVPERHIDGAHGGDGHGTASEILGSAIHHLPKSFDFQRVLAKQNLPQPARDVVAEGSVDNSLDDLR